MIFFTLLIHLLHFSIVPGWQNLGLFTVRTMVQSIMKPKVLFGTASFYADKFNGRKTATGDIYSHNKMTAACNLLPLGSWIRVTNLRNRRSVIVRVNDRLHPKNKRVVDMSKRSAEQLGYIARGLTQVKVEVLEKSNKN